MLSGQLRGTATLPLLTQIVPAGTLLHFLGARTRIRAHPVWWHMVSVHDDSAVAFPQEHFVRPSRADSVKALSGSRGQ